MLLITCLLSFFLCNYTAASEIQRLITQDFSASGTTFIGDTWLRVATENPDPIHGYPVTHLALWRSLQGVEGCETPEDVQREIFPGAKFFQGVDPDGTRHIWFQQANNPTLYKIVSGKNIPEVNLLAPIEITVTECRRDAVFCVCFAVRHLAAFLRAPLRQDG